MTYRQETAGTSRAGRKRLRNGIVGGALAVIFTLLFLFAGFTYWQGKTILEAESMNALEAIAAAQEARAADYAEHGLADLNLITGRGLLIAALQEYGATGEQSQLANVLWVLSEVEMAATDIDAIYVFDRDLQLVADSAEEGSAVEVPDGYLSVGAGGVVSGLVTRTQSGEVVHLLAGPVTSGGDLVGVAVVAQSTEQLFGIATERSGLGDTGETIIAQGSPERASFIAPTRFDPSAVLEPVPSHIEGLPMTVALSGREGEQGSGVDYRGQKVLSVTRFIEGPGWGLVVKMDRTEVLAPLDEFALVALGVLSFALVLAYFLSARYAEWVLRPVRKLTRTAQAIAGGRRDLRVGSDRDDEIGELASAFDEMTRQLNTLTTELEERVDERTRELREKNAQLARLMQEKETFLAGVSHEVRSPLTAMIGFLDLVNESGDALTGAERAEMLDTVSRQADDVLNLIEDLLASARVEAGTLKVVSVRTDLAAQVRQVVEAVEPITRVEMSVRGDGVLADADPARIRQIVRNLLSNADRYGGSSVEVVVAGRDGTATIEVRDDGGGVPEADRGRIFEAYGQARSGRKVDGSVGLGLAVSRQLARLMGGDLTYHFRDGWSVFMLTLPEHQESDETVESQRPSLAATP